MISGRGAVIWALSVAGVVFGVMAGAEAARQPPMSLDELLAQSGRIVEARVVEVDIEAGDGEVPKTRVSLVVERAYGPDEGEASVELWLPEGIEVGSTIWSGYVGIPTFVPGETYLLFLRRAPWRVSPVVNWTWGHLRRVAVGGREVFVDMQGACATGLDDAGLRRGPRVVDPPPVPGRGGGISSIAPRPSAVGACMGAAELRARLAARVRAAGWMPGPVPFAPVSWSLAVPVEGGR